MPAFLRVMSPVVACALMVLGGAWLGDRLIGLILPDDPCHEPLMIITVAYFTLMFLMGMFYLVGLTLKITRPYRRHILPQRTGMHVIGCAALGFSALTPFIVLHGPHSGVAYGERVAVTEAIERTVMLQQALSAFWRLHGHFPASVEELPALPDQSASSVARRIAFDVLGDITVEFASRRYSHLDGQTLILRPRLQNGLPVWDCLGGSLPDLQRPAMCRRRSICEDLLILFKGGTTVFGQNEEP